MAPRARRTGLRLDLRLGALRTAAVVIAGCAAHYGSTLRSGQVAVLDADTGTLMPSQTSWSVRRAPNGKREPPRCGPRG